MAWLARSKLDSLLVPHRATIVSPEHGQPRNHTYAVGHAVLSGEQPTSPFADDEAAGYEKKNSGVCRRGPRYPLILLAAHYDSIRRCWRGRNGLHGMSRGRFIRAIYPTEALA